MGDKSHIEWTETTWNPVTGCTKISVGCRNCYAEVMARRLKAMGTPKYANGFEVTVHEDLLHQPFEWKQPRVVFVNSMSDLFHEDIPLDFIKRVFAVMADSPLHTFQVLTKRAERLAELSGQLPWPPNVWMGVTVEHADYKGRIADLARTGARVKFLSCEPLLSSLGALDLAGIDWVIVGGESGMRARPMAKEWVREIRDQCQQHGVAFFFKQWGGRNKKKAGRELDGRLWDEMPAVRPQRVRPAAQTAGLP